MTIRY